MFQTQRKFFRQSTCPLPSSPIPDLRLGLVAGRSAFHGGQHDRSH